MSFFNVQGLFLISFIATEGFGVWPCPFVPYPGSHAIVRECSGLLILGSCEKNTSQEV